MCIRDSTGTTHSTHYLTDRSSRDLPTMIRFERNTPEECRAHPINAEWVSWLMGFSHGYTNFTSAGLNVPVPRPRGRGVPPVAVLPQSLMTELSKVHSGEVTVPSDITLSTEDEDVPVHSFVLALRSPVLREQLADAPRGAAVRLHRKVKGAALRELLKFLYTDEASPKSPKEAKRLLRAAKLYSLPRLRSICESYIQRSKK